MRISNQFRVSMNPNTFHPWGLPPQYPPLRANWRSVPQPAPITAPLRLPPVLYSAGRQPRLPSGNGPQPLSPDNPHRFIVNGTATRIRTGQEPAPSPRRESEQINSSTHPQVTRANRKRTAPEPVAELAPEPAAAPHIKRQRGLPGAAARAPAIDSPDAGDSVMQQASAELLCDTLFPPSSDNPLGLRNRHYLQRHTGLMGTLNDVFRSGDLRPGQSVEALFRAFCGHGLRPANSGHLASLLREADMIWIYLAGPGRQATERQKSLFVVWSLSVGEAGPRAQAPSQVAQAQRERLNAIGQQHCHGFRKGLSALTQHCIESLDGDLCVDREQLLKDLCAQGLPMVFARLIVSAWEQAASQIFRRKLRLDAGTVKLGDVVKHAEKIIRHDVVRCFAGILCTALDAPDTQVQLGQGLGAFQNPESYTSFLEWVGQTLRQYCQELVAPCQDQ